MAKGNIKIIKHDDHDIKYFIGLLGVNELKRIFLNEDGIPRTDFMNAQSFFNSKNRLFYTEDGMQWSLPYFEYLDNQTKKKIKNLAHKSQKYDGLIIEARMSFFSRNLVSNIDLRFVHDVERFLCSIEDPMSSLLVTTAESDTPIPWQQADATWVDVPAFDMIKKLNCFVDTIFKAKPKAAIPGKRDELVAYVTMKLIISPMIEKTSTLNKIINLSTENACSEAFKNSHNTLEWANRVRIVANILAMTVYYILDELETRAIVQQRSKTVTPDTFARHDQLARSFGKGRQHKLAYVSCSIRNITYKIWLYYWQHTHPKFVECSSTGTEKKPIFTAKEMILALAEAFPNTAIALDDASSHGLAARRNLISELFKYPSLVDAYFNHETEK